MITDLIHWRANLTPQRLALWAAGRWYSYAELNLRAIRLANRLRAAGVGRGDRVGIVALNHIAHIDLLLAAPKLGFVFTPFNYRLSVEEHQRLSDYVRPKFLFADARHQPLAQVTSCAWQPLAEYEDWLAAGSSSTPAAPSPNADDTQMILFTGGSTGLPKGAQIPYRQVYANCVNTVKGWELLEGDCVVQATPCFHAAINAFATPLFYLGGRVVLMPQFDAGEYLSLLVEHQATLMFMVPTMYQMLSADSRFDSADLSQVRWAISGGAPCPPTIRAAYARRGLRFKQGYGMTEAGVNCFMMGLDEADRHPQSVGHPLPNTQAVIRRGDGTPCEVDEIGELTLAGPQVCKGYFEREQEWAKVFRDGWLWTGDLARRDASGLHFIVGRSKEMFISGGENVYPAEVEAALYQCPDVAEAAVLGVANEKWGEVGLAAIALKAGSAGDAERIKAALKTRLAGYKLPREYLFLPALPKTGAGKVAKPEIKKLWEARGKA